MYPQLTDYVNQSKKSGVSDEQIRQNLLSQGWSEQDIQSAMVGGQSSIFIAPNVQLKSKKAIIKTIALVAIFLALAAGAYAFYVKQKKAIVPFPLETQSPTPTVQSQTDLGPKATYLKLRTEIDKANSYEEVIPIAKFYQSSRQTQKIGNLPQMDVTPELKLFVFNGLKSAEPTSSDIENAIEEIKDNTATLKAKTKTGKTCIVNMLLEGTAWKIDEVECSSTSSVQQFPIVANCGSIKEDHLFNEEKLTNQEKQAVACMAAALQGCSTGSVVYERPVTTVTYQVDGKLGANCKISQITNFKKTCQIPLDYMASRYKKAASTSQERRNINFVFDSFVDFEVGGGYDSSNNFIKFQCN